MRQNMTNEQERLDTMFRENKISGADYKLLSQALAKKAAPINATFSLLINPFQKIAGLPALVLGLVAILSMSYLGTLGNMSFPGALDFSVTATFVNHKIPSAFLFNVYQCLVSWLVVVVALLISAKILQQKYIRIMDFMGTVALSRLPSLIFVALYIAVRRLHPSTFVKGALHASHISPVITLLILIMNLCSLWQIVTYFSAFKESSGLTGKKLWLGYIIAMTLAETVSMPLATIFV